MRALPPQHLRDYYWLDIEKQLKVLFYQVVFQPVMEVIRGVTPQAKGMMQIQNAKGDVFLIIDAIRTGRIQYELGVFSGEFSMAISKQLKGIGARFDQRSKVYRLDVISVPDIVRVEAATYQATARAANAEMLRKLNEIQLNLDRTIDSKEIDATQPILSIEEGWKKNAQILQVQPTLSKQATERLKADYTNNLKLYIKKFSRESVQTLRGVVEENAMEGYRFDKLLDQIRHRYGVTASKAKFLARQETALFMSKYQQQRYLDAGVRRYRWSTSHDERVRTSHAALDGKVYSWDDPPNTAGPGVPPRFNNPGGDYNCRCVAIPLLEEAYSGV